MGWVRLERKRMRAFKKHYIQGVLKGWVKMGQRKGHL